MTKKEFKSSQRHYTIAQCMRKEMFDEFVRSIKEGMELKDKAEVKSKGVTFNKKLVDQSYVNFQTLSVKTYHRGLSKIFFDRVANANGHFLVKGPVGKGLGITNESQGVHIAFTAGTGILVFMDLVMKIYLGRIGAIPEKDRLHPLFKFVLFASF